MSRRGPAPRSVQWRVFKCTGCGSKALAPKRRAKTRKGHIKPLWCYRCKKRTLHRQLN